MNPFSKESPTNISPAGTVFCLLIVAAGIYVVLFPPPSSTQPSAPKETSEQTKPQAEAPAPVASPQPKAESDILDVGIYNLPNGEYLVLEAKDGGPTTPDGLVHRFNYVVIDISKVKEKRKIRVTCEQPILIPPMSKAGDTWRINAPGSVQVERGSPSI